MNWIIPLIIGAFVPGFIFWLPWLLRVIDRHQEYRIKELQGKANARFFDDLEIKMDPSGRSATYGSKIRHGDTLETGHTGPPPIMAYRR